MSTRVKHDVAIGIDVGGTGIKGAAVQTGDGSLLTPRDKVATPDGGRPDDIAREIGAMVARIRDELHSRGAVSKEAQVPVGVTLPGVVRGGVMMTAANVDHSWIGTNAHDLLSDAAGSDCLVVNDADAAGIAEVAFGAARDLPGVTLVLTFGTGIGSALVHDGVLVPNFELGHLQFDGHTDIERYASAKVIEREGISTAEWAGRVAPFVEHLEFTMNPDRFVLGGGISKAANEYLPFTGVDVPVIPAQFRNNAGIVGAARLAAEGALDWE